MIPGSDRYYAAKHYCHYKGEVAIKVETSQKDDGITSIILQNDVTEEIVFNDESNALCVSSSDLPNGVYLVRCD